MRSEEAEPTPRGIILVVQQSVNLVGLPTPFDVCFTAGQHPETTIALCFRIDGKKVTLSCQKVVQDAPTSSLLTSRVERALMRPALKTFSLSLVSWTLQPASTQHNKRNLYVSLWYGSDGSKCIRACSRDCRSRMRFEYGTVVVIVSQCAAIYRNWEGGNICANSCMEY